MTVPNESTPADRLNVEPISAANAFAVVLLSSALMVLVAPDSLLMTFLDAAATEPVAAPSKVWPL